VDPRSRHRALRRIGGWAARGASIYFGARILHHEVYVSEQAELAVIALGLLLIGVPPALWLDTLTRTTEALGGRRAEDPPRELQADEKAEA
jgi:hypothetical protein